MSFFGKVIDHMTETSEQMIKVVEDGAAILMGYNRENDDEGGATFAYENEVTNDGTFDFSQLSEDQILNEPSPLNDIAQGLLSDIMMHQHGPQSSWDQFQAFKAAITWSEPFILSLLFFHIFMFFVNIFVMRSGNLVGRFLLIAFFAVVIRGAEVLNQYGSSNWEKFATQNYFDKNGVFVSLMLSAPLLLIAFIHLIVLLRESKNLLIEVKTLQLKDKLKKKSKQSRDEKAASTRSKKDN